MTALLDEVRYAQTLLDFQPRPIHDDAENARATELLMRLSESGELTPEKQAVAEILATLIEAYEARYAIDASTPLSMLRELMAANDLKQKDIVPYIGSIKVPHIKVSRAANRLPLNNLADRLRKVGA